MHSNRFYFVWCFRSMFVFFWIFLNINWDWFQHVIVKSSCLEFQFSYYNLNSFTFIYGWISKMENICFSKIIYTIHMIQRIRYLCSRFQTFQLYLVHNYNLFQQKRIQCNYLLYAKIIMHVRCYSLVNDIQFFFIWIFCE